MSSYKCLIKRVALSSQITRRGRCCDHQVGLGLWPQPRGRQEQEQVRAQSPSPQGRPQVQPERPQPRQGQPPQQGRERPRARVRCLSLVQAQQAERTLQRLSPQSEIMNQLRTFLAETIWNSFLPQPAQAPAPVEPPPAPSLQGWGRWPGPWWPPRAPHSWRGRGRSRRQGASAPCCCSVPQDWFRRTSELSWPSSAKKTLCFFSHFKRQPSFLPRCVGGDLRILCAVGLCAGNQLLFVTDSTYLTAVRCRPGWSSGRGPGLTNCLLPPRPGLSLVWRVLWECGVWADLAWLGANCHRQGSLLFLAGSRPQCGISPLSSPRMSHRPNSRDCLNWSSLHFWVIGCVDWLFDQTIIQMTHYSIKGQLLLNTYTWYLFIDPIKWHPKSE